MKNQIIRLDGSNICYCHRDKDGVHIKICPNEMGELKSGEHKEVPLTEYPKEFDYRIDINDKTYVSMLKCLLAYADRVELCRILNNPIDGSAWTVAQRRSKVAG